MWPLPPSSLRAEARKEGLIEGHCVDDVEYDHLGLVAGMLELKPESGLKENTRSKTPDHKHPITNKQALRRLIPLFPSMASGLRVQT